MKILDSCNLDLITYVSDCLKRKLFETDLDSLMDGDYMDTYVTHEGKKIYLRISIKNPTPNPSSNKD